MTAETTIFEPPEHLQGSAKRWFCEVVEIYDFSDEPHSLKLLESAATALQRAEQCREVLDQKGLTYADRFGQPKPRPEAAIEATATNTFRLCCRELRLEVPSDEAVRLPRI